MYRQSPVKTPDITEHDKRKLLQTQTRVKVARSAFLCLPAIGNELKNAHLIFHHFLIKLLHKYVKKLKKHILTSVWSVQHLNDG